MSTRSEKRQARKAADRAEYEESLHRAEQAAREQQAHPGSNKGLLGFTFGLPGLAIGAVMDAKKRPQPPAQ